MMNIDESRQLKLYLLYTMIVRLHVTLSLSMFVFFFFQAEDGIRDIGVTGVQTCALPISGIVDRIAVIAVYVADVVRGVEAQAIHAKVFEPHQRIVTDELANFRATVIGTDRKSVV